MMWVKSVLAKYWILLCCGAFLLVGLQNEVSVYQIGYMAIFLFILICYQVNCVFHNDTKDMEQLMTVESNYVIVPGRKILENQNQSHLVHVNNAN